MNPNRLRSATLLFHTPATRMAAAGPMECLLRARTPYTAPGGKTTSSITSAISRWFWSGGAGKTCSATTTPPGLRADLSQYRWLNAREPVRLRSHGRPSLYGSVRRDTLSPMMGCDNRSRLQPPHHLLRNHSSATASGEARKVIYQPQCRRLGPEPTLRERRGQPSCVGPGDNRRRVEVRQRTAWRKRCAPRQLRLRYERRSGTPRLRPTSCRSRYTCPPSRRSSATFPGRASGQTGPQGRRLAAKQRYER